MNNADFHTKNENYSLSRIHFRCPTCSKLYSSDPTGIYVQEPEYTCSKCKTEFSISLLNALQNTEVVGSAITRPIEEPNLKESDSMEKPMKESKLEKRAAQGVAQQELQPKAKELSSSPQILDLPVHIHKKAEVQADAQKKVEDLQQEFDFESLDLHKDDEVNLSFNDLNQEKIKNDFDLRWAEVLDHYESRELHNAFVKYCKSQNQLDFAVGKYAKLLEINPNDTLAASFLKKIEMSLESQVKFEAASKPKFFTRSFYITLGVVLCGILLVGVGSLWFQNKNIAGLGLGLVFFTFAAKAFFQPRHLDH